MPCFETHASATTSKLESVNSDDYEEPLPAYLSKDLDLSIEFKPFGLTHSEDKPFEHDISTSYFVKEIVTNSSNKIDSKLDIILTLATKDSKASPSLSSEKSFSPSRGDFSLECKYLFLSSLKCFFEYSLF